METAKAYWQLTKPRITLAIFALFILAALASALGNYWLSLAEKLSKFLVGAAAVFASAAGSNALNCYFDRDVDSIMVRTRRRPIPQGKIRAKNGLLFSITFLGTSLVLTYLVGFLPTVLLLLGLSSYLLFYTLLLKRKNPLNVFATAPAVASPVWFGWIVGRGYLDFQGVLMGSVVMLWGPLHLWSLAMLFSKDYEKVNVPMLPVVVGWQKACWHILVLSIMLSFTSVLPFLLNYFGVIYLAGVTTLNTILIFLSVRALTLRTGRSAWLLYKFSAPYMVGLLLMATIDRLITLQNW